MNGETITGPPADPRDSQFSLRALFLWVSTFCLLLGFVSLVRTFGMPAVLAGIMLIVFLASVSGAILFKKPEALIIAGAMVLAAFCLPDPPRDSRKSHCTNQLRNVVLALQNYHDVHGQFPPAYIADATGKPMHSWRVLLMPYMELNSLYQSYDFNEPWNGPNNSKLGNDPSIARLFRCPAEKGEGAKLLETSYVIVRGKETAWPGSLPLDDDSLSDGGGETLLIVEVKNSGIHWMEPRDLDFQTLTMRINPPRAQGLSSNHPHGCNAACCDGSVHFLDDDLPPASLRALLTKAGGEPNPLLRNRRK